MLSYSPNRNYTLETLNWSKNKTILVNKRTNTKILSANVCSLTENKNRKWNGPHQYSILDCVQQFVERPLHQHLIIEMPLWLRGWVCCVHNWAISTYWTVITKSQLCNEVAMPDMILHQLKSVQQNNQIIIKKADWSWCSLMTSHNKNFTFSTIPN